MKNKEEESETLAYQSHCLTCDWFGLGYCLDPDRCGKEAIAKAKQLDLFA